MSRLLRAYHLKFEIKGRITKTIFLFDYTVQLRSATTNYDVEQQYIMIIERGKKNRTGMLACFLHLYQISQPYEDRSGNIW